MKSQIQVDNSIKFDNLSKIVICSHLLYANGTDVLDALVYTFWFVLSLKENIGDFFIGFLPLTFSKLDCRVSNH